MAVVDTIPQGKALDGSVHPLQDTPEHNSSSSKTELNGKVGDRGTLSPSDRALTGKQEHCETPRPDDPGILVQTMWLILV